MPWSVGGSLVESSAELMPVSLTHCGEIGKIGLEGGYVCSVVRKSGSALSLAES